MKNKSHGTYPLVQQVPWDLSTGAISPTGHIHWRNKSHGTYPLVQLAPWDLSTGVISPVGLICLCKSRATHQLVQ